MLHRLPTKLACGLFVVALCVAPASAQTVQWLDDYGTARRESAEKNRPIVMTLSTASCGWCRQLEATTLRDPSVVRMLGEQFIALKVAADDPRNAYLVEALRVKAFPTIVTISADGKVVESREGYADAANFLPILQRAVASANLGGTDWRTRTYQRAVAAMARADYASTIALLRTVITEGGSRSVSEQAQKLLVQLEQQAGQQFAKAKQLQAQGQTTAAINAFETVVTTYPSTETAVKAGQAISAMTEKTATPGPQASR